MTQTLSVQARTSAILVALCVAGSLSILPMVIEARARAGMPVESVGRLALAAVVQTLVVFGPAAFFGLWAAAAAGLPGAPVVSRLAGGEATLPAASAFTLAAASGLAAGAVVVVLDLALFQAQVGIKADPLFAPGFWNGLLAGILYGGVNEEVLMRLFIVSVLIYLAIRFLGAETGHRFAWAAVAVAALLFALSHLPITSMLAPLTPLLVVRGLVLNGLVGLVCGWIYLRHGLECAILAHALTHVPIQLGASGLS